MEPGVEDAKHPYILALKDIIGPLHSMPADVIDDASIIIAYYVLFIRELAKTNALAGRFTSPEWELAYEQTNAMLKLLNTHLIEYLKNCPMEALST